MKNSFAPIFTLLFLFTFCKQTKNDDSKNINKIDSLPRNLNQNTDVDKDFKTFIEYFSKDSLFQISRIEFPFKEIQTGIDDDKDSTILIDKLHFRKMDFSKKRYDGQYDKWNRHISVQEKKATIEIRGINNGIYIDYYFEKINGLWKFIKVVDSST